MATATEYRNMSVDDLKKELIELRREQFNLRMQQGAGNMPKVHRFGAVRKDIARIKTVLTQKTETGS
ncbi:MAG: 50S ribosomal protein L29 [Thiotrichales bacterium]|nr:MAG: 50S ribosomal protein L29 [Thiotrichales bacterium]